MPMTREGKGTVAVADGVPEGPMMIRGKVTLVLDGFESRVDVEGHHGLFYTIPFSSVAYIEWEPSKEAGV